MKFEFFLPGKIFGGRGKKNNDVPTEERGTILPIEKVEDKYKTPLTKTPEEEVLLSYEKKSSKNIGKGITKPSLYRT